ncbi:MAG TPA: DPP IV N-terminal domain-containing protein, partial [Puia sp.]|nr:DPP IV N-terminal domain-containing protein [Puia sp.]
MNKSLFLLLTLSWAVAARAQQGGTLTANDYAHAETLLGYGTEPLVDNGPARPNWLPGDRFWYRVLTAKGSEFILVNPAKGTRSPAFDQQKLAASLSAVTGQAISADHLPFQQIRYSADGKFVSFRAAGKYWNCDLHDYTCVADSSRPAGSDDMGSGGGQRNFNEEVSPDGKKTAFIKDYNLWVRDVASGKETQLTTDGVKDFGYATDNAGWKHSDRAILAWSPDSRKIATFQQDQRNVGDM